MSGWLVTAVRFDRGQGWIAGPTVPVRGRWRVRLASRRLARAGLRAHVGRDWGEEWATLSGPLDQVLQRETAQPHQTDRAGRPRNATEGRRGQ